MSSSRVTTEISVSNRQSALKIPISAVRRAVRVALEYAGIRPRNMSVVLVGQSEMIELNRRFARVRGTTDVLAFDLSEGPSAPGDTVTGEVVANAELAIIEAKHRGCIAADEALLYIVHGVLHLCGYRDHLGTEKKRMRKAEADVLERIRAASATVKRCRRR